MICRTPRGRAASSLAAAFLLAACAGAQSSPEGAVRSFLDALEAGDPAAFRASLTPRTAELVDEIEVLSEEIQGDSGQPVNLEEWCRAFCGATVVGSQLDGDTALVTIEIGAGEEEIPVTRLEDGWRVDLSARLEPAVQLLRLTLPAEGDQDTLP